MTNYISLSQAFASLQTATTIGQITNIAGSVQANTSGAYSGFVTYFGGDGAMHALRVLARTVNVS